MTDEDDPGEESHILARIAHALPWIGDPYLIPLAHIPERYSEAVRVMRWQNGVDDTDEAKADRRYWREVERMKRAAIRSSSPYFG